MARYLIEEIEKAQNQLETNNAVMWEINRKYWKGLTMARAIINEQPTADVVEVVRCKDCRFASIDTEGSYYVICLNPDVPWSRYKDEFSLPPNHYCSYGERKE